METAKREGIIEDKTLDTKEPTMRRGVLACGIEKLARELHNVKAKFMNIDGERMGRRKKLIEIEEQEAANRRRDEEEEKTKLLDNLSETTRKRRELIRPLDKINEVASEKMGERTK